MTRERAAAAARGRSGCPPLARALHGRSRRPAHRYRASVSGGLARKFVIGDPPPRRVRAGWAG